jgi:hypothetical protein
MKILDSLLVAVQVIYFIFIKLLSHCFEVLQSFYDTSSQLRSVDLIIHFFKWESPINKSLKHWSWLLMKLDLICHSHLADDDFISFISKICQSRYFLFNHLYLAVNRVLTYLNLLLQQHEILPSQFLINKMILCKADHSLHLLQVLSYILTLLRLIIINLGLSGSWGWRVSCQTILIAAGGTAPQVLRFLLFVRLWWHRLPRPNRLQSHTLNAVTFIGFLQVHDYWFNLKPNLRRLIQGRQWLFQVLIYLHNYFRDLFIYDWRGISVLLFGH